MNKTAITLRDDVASAIKCNENPLSIAPTLRASLKEFVSSSCIHPRKLKVRDRFTHEVKEIYVPCGHCHYCRSKRQGEWVSRMILQTLYCSKCCYFVTLTYGGFEHLGQVPKQLRNAYYHLDDDNYNNKMLYSPCLLRHEHVQRFMKYLRKFHGEDRIGMFCAGEYGSDYGRPHFHLILWSDEPISKELVCRAWSVRLPKSKCTTLIGRVDFNDLMNNGTIIKADGINFGHDMHKCFTYVAKYMSKSFVDILNPVDDKSRLKYFVRDLATRTISNTDIDYVFDNRIRHLSSLYNDWANWFSDYVREKEYQHEKQRYNIKFNSINQERVFRKAIYDYETSPIQFQIYRDSLVSQSELSCILKDWHPQINPLVFRKVFRPYCITSRAVGIGVSYFLPRVERFVKGKFELPKYDGKILMFPSVFVRKTKEYLFRYAQIVQKAIGVSHSVNLLINKDDFNSFFTDPQSIRFDLYSCKILPSYDFGVSVDLDKCLRSDCAFYDYRTSTRCLAFVDPDYNITISHYRYDRKIKSFVYVRSQPYSDFLQSVLDSFNSYTYLHARLDQLQSVNGAILEQYLEDISLFVDSILDTSFVSALDDSYNDYLTSLSCRKKHFDALKPPQKSYMKL